MPFTILVVDDELEMCLSLVELFESLGYQAYFGDTEQKVLSILTSRKVNLILMDVRMPDINGITLLKKIKNNGSAIPIIMISGHASVENIVEAMRFGALNFYEKPLQFDKLLHEVKKIELAAESVPIVEHQPKIITYNAHMQEILRNIEKTAKTSASVIITGESGTGKELAANAIHTLSHRSDKPFIKLNCAAIPDTLLESELFGHEKGAFTDAKQKRIGKFELAQGGSIFFDEIGDMSILTQAKLLRVLQEREFERIGGSETIKADVRVITATHHSIKKLITEGKFREDLFYRLSVITINLPPLRKRVDDILPLSAYLLTHFSRVYKKQLTGLSPEVEKIFLTHNWPGNVRELKNCLERASIFAEHETIELEDLPVQYRKQQNILPSEDEMESRMNSLTKEIILEALVNAGGKRQRAAELLGIHRKTLYNKMKRLGML